jgi:hypothetical protein
MSNKKANNLFLSHQLISVEVTGGLEPPYPVLQTGD